MEGPYGPICDRGWPLRVDGPRTREQQQLVSELVRELLEALKAATYYV